MKYGNLLAGGALAAATLTAGAVSAASVDSVAGVVFCKATITQREGNEEADVSVTLPFTSTMTNGTQYTYWNVGTVPAGGVADSWHAEGGPGRFVAHNSGSVGAYVYLTSRHFDVSYPGFWTGEGPVWSSDDGVYAGNDVYARDIYGYDGLAMPYPLASLDSWRGADGGYGYCLAFSRDVTAKAPTWHLLDHAWGNGWYLVDREVDVSYIGAYMGYLDAGDYMPFDVKFWAPRSTGHRADWDVAFTFKVEAASFPLWEHDRDVR